MAMVMGEPPRGAKGSPKRWLWTMLALLLVAAVATGAFVWGRTAATPTPAPRPGATAAQQPQQPSDASTVRWVSAPGGIVPVSPVHGPRNVSGPLATGYSHDAMGAVMAAANITTRLASAAGTETYLEVLQNQTVGSMEAMRAQLEQESSSSTTPPVPKRWWWHIPRGNPQGDLVEVVLYVETDQSQAIGSYVRTSQMLVWSGSDWQVQVPLTPAKFVSDLSGAVPLGG